MRSLDMQTNVIERLKVLGSVEDLKTLASFKILKKNLQQVLGLEIKAGGWQKLYEKLELLKNSITQHEISLKALLQDEVLDPQRKAIKKMLSFKVLNNQEAELKANLVIWLSLINALSPEQKYELNKRRNFINSSRLENIKLPAQPNLSLDDVLNKYKAI